MSFDSLDKLAGKVDRITTLGLISDKALQMGRDPGNIFGGKARFEDLKIPKAPTIDEAGKSRDEFDRIRRRRGILATIFSKNASSTPAVATQQLLG